MQEVFENIIEKLEERTSFLSDCTKYGNKDAEQQYKSYSAMMMYEVSDLVDDLIEIVKQEAEKFVPDTNVGNNGWIPCSERVPKVEDLHEKSVDDCTCYLIQRRCGIMDVAHYIKVYGEPYFEANSIKMKDVIAWHPLPLPYQPKGE